MTDNIKFVHLALLKKVLDAIYKKGLEEPPPIQAL